MPVLRSMIWQITALLKTSAGRAQFDRVYARLTTKEYQPRLFGEDE